MTKCEGTTGDQSLLNRKLREAIATDSRVTRLFTRVEIEVDDWVGVVVLDDTYATNQVRQCVNAMKKTGSWETTSVKQEPQDEVSNKHISLCDICIFYSGLVYVELVRRG